MSAPGSLPPAVVRRRRLQLVALAALFLGPLAFAAWLYYGSGVRPAGRLEHGELANPPRPLPEAVLATPGGGRTAPRFLRGKWSLITVARGDCEARCRAALATTRRVRAALNEDAARVQRVLLAPAGCCRAPLPDESPAELVTAWLDGAGGRELAAALGGGTAPEDGRIYLADPLGNLVLSYAAGADPKGLLTDLERLLRLSHIG